MQILYHYSTLKTSTRVKMRKRGRFFRALFPNRAETSGHAHSAAGAAPCALRRAPARCYISPAMRLCGFARRAAPACFLCIALPIVAHFKARHAVNARACLCVAHFDGCLPFLHMTLAALRAHSVLVFSHPLCFMACQQSGRAHLSHCPRLVRRYKKRRMRACGV